MSPAAQSRDDTPVGGGDDERDTASGDDLAHRTGAALADGFVPIEANDIQNLTRMVASPKPVAETWTASLQ
jgi:hypothetical protein